MLSLIEFLGAIYICVIWGIDKEIWEVMKVILTIFVLIKIFLWIC